MSKLSAAGDCSQRSEVQSGGSTLALLCHGNERDSGFLVARVDVPVTVCTPFQ